MGDPLRRERVFSLNLTGFILKLAFGRKGRREQGQKGDGRDAEKKGDVREVEKKGDVREVGKKGRRSRGRRKGRRSRGRKGEIRAGQKRGDTRELRGRQRSRGFQKMGTFHVFFSFLHFTQSAKVGW